MYESELEGPNRRGRPLGRWKDRAEEYLGGRDINGWEGLEQASRLCREREVKTLMPWPPLKGTFPEEDRHQSYR